MNCDKNITVAFTGHRIYDGGVDEQMYTLLEELCAKGYRRFLTGMSWGFDLAAAEAVVRLKQRYADVELVAVEPFAWFGRLFSGEDAERYKRIKVAADRVVMVGKSGEPRDYIARNDYLVDKAAVVVAWWSGAKRGGTAYTIRRARQQGVECINLFNLQGELF